MSENDKSPPPPSLQKFCKAIDCCNQSSIESFWECEESFRSLINSKFLEELLKSQLDSYLKFDASPDIQCGEKTYAQLDLPEGLQLDILHISTGHVDEVLQSHPCNMLFGFKTKSANSYIEIDIYETPDEYENEVFTPDVPLSFVECKRLIGSEVQKASAGKTAFRIRKVEGDIMVLLLKSPPTMNFSWSYDLKTLKAVSGVVPYLPSYRLNFAAQILGNIPSSKSIKSLKKLSQYNAHFVRWTALQSLFEIDYDCALKRLKQALDDKHPNIRNASAQALKRIKEI